MHETNVVKRRSCRNGAIALVAVLACLPAAASDRHHLGLPAGAGKQSYTAECGSCHLAYPPQLLAMGGWSRMMASLDRHFGVDASLDPATGRAIAGYLAANAGSERRFGAGSMRISETPWFRREHDEVPAPVWKLPQTRSAANCAACHTGADRGDYSEDGVQLPAAAARTAARGSAR